MTAYEADGSVRWIACCLTPDEFHEAMHEVLRDGLKHELIRTRQPDGLIRLQVMKKVQGGSFSVTSVHADPMVDPNPRTEKRIRKCLKQTLRIDPLTSHASLQ